MDLAEVETTQPEQSPPALPTMGVARGLRKLLYLFLAALFFAVGIAGVLLPGLPATPFLLLTSYFLLRSSPRLNAMLLRSRLVGPILHDWQVNGGVRRDIKLKAIGCVVVAVAMTQWLAVESTMSRLIVGGLALVGIIVIALLPSARNS